jgi:hypothetical protein
MIIFIESARQGQLSVATGSATLANWVMQRPAEGEFLQNVNAKERYVFEVNISEYTKET